MILLSLASRGNKISHQNIIITNENDAALNASTSMDIGLSEDLSSVPNTDEDDTLIGPLEEAVLLQEAAPPSPVNPLPTKSRELPERLTGAARKRFKWLLAKGVPVEEARTKALIPCGRQKRNRSDPSLPSVQRKKIKMATPSLRSDNVASTSKITPPPQPQKTYKQALEHFKVGILASNFPDTLLNNEQMTAIQDAIFDKILNLTEGSIKPKFRGSTFRPGWLTFNCKDKPTAEWLKNLIGSIKPWEGASLKAVDDDNIPRDQILVGHFPVDTSFGSDKILRAIGAQNADLLVPEWRVIKRETKGNMAFLTFSVDHKSIECLKRQHYKIDFRFGEVTLRFSKSSRPIDIPTSNPAPPVTHPIIPPPKSSTVVTTAAETPVSISSSLSAPLPSASTSSAMAPSMNMDQGSVSDNPPSLEPPRSSVKVGPSRPAPQLFRPPLTTRSPSSSKAAPRRTHHEGRVKGKPRQKLIKAPRGFTSTP